MTSMATLPELLARPGITVVPGGGTALELRLIELAGFEAGYVSGYATAAAVYGVPDVGLIAYNEIEKGIDVESTGLVRMEATRPSMAGVA